MISRDILTLAEAKSVDTMSRIEDTIHEYGIKIEVRLHIIIRETVLILLHLSRIIEAVVRLEAEVSTLRLLSILLDSLCLSLRLRFVSLNHLTQEGIDVIRILCHRL